MDHDAVIQTWRARHDLGRHDENVSMLEDLLSAGCRSAELHLLIATSLLGAEREQEVFEHVDAAVALGEEDPGVLTRAASQYFHGGDLSAARKCADRAAALAGRDFIFGEELRELRRNIALRAKRATAEQELSDAFDEDPGQPKIGEALARLLARHGRTYAAYVVVLRALRQRPHDRRLVKLRDKLARAIPPDQRAELEAEA